MVKVSDLLVAINSKIFLNLYIKGNDNAYINEYSRINQILNVEMSVKIASRYFD